MLYRADIMAQITNAPEVDGITVKPPVLFHAPAIDINQESRSSVDGRYQDGEIRGTYTPKPQDTYITGTAGRAGIAFTTDSGTPRTDWKSSRTGKYGILFPNSLPNATFEVHETGGVAGIGHYKIVVGRGVSSTSATHDGASIYCYLYLADQSTNGGYRLKMAWGHPVALQYAIPGADQDVEASWRTVAIARSLGDFETLLNKHNNEITIVVTPDANTGVLRVEVGDGHVLKHSPGRQQTDARTVNAQMVPIWPNAGGIRFKGKNGWASLEVYPLRYQAVTVTRDGLKPPPDTDVSKATTTGNFLSNPDATQTHTSSVTKNSDGTIKASLTASNPDAGDGLGSETPPIISDMLVYEPPIFAGGLPGFLKPMFLQDMPIIQIRESQVWDDNLHYGYTSGSATWNNHSGWFRGMYGNYAFGYAAGNGWSWANRFRGLLGVGPQGIELSRQDPLNLVSANFHDNTFKLLIPLEQELILDGLCLFTAIRILCMAGGITPDKLTAIPDVGLPPYPDAMPYPVLGKGTGMSPRYRFMPNVPIRNIILDLLSDTGMPVYDAFGTPAATVPFYFWQDQFGNMHCDPYNTFGMQIVKHYYTDNRFSVSAGNDLGLINGPLKVHTSVEQMRTEVHIQGLDPLTNELLVGHLPLPGNIPVVGYRSPAFDRSARYCSQAAVENALGLAAWQASLPDQFVSFPCVFDPNIWCGQLIAVTDNKTLGRTGVFRIVQIESVLGFEDVTQQSGTGVVQSHITARNAEKSAIAY